MLTYLRRHRRRLTHGLLGLLTLAWLSVAVQPCVAAAPAPVEPVAYHHGSPAGHHHGMAAMAVHEHEVSMAEEHCTQGDCPLFSAVENSIAGKPVSPDGEPMQLPPVVLLSVFLLAEHPLLVPLVQSLRDPAIPVPEPPILAFRVLLI